MDVLTDQALERAAEALADWDEDNSGADWFSPRDVVSDIAENYREYYRNGVRTVLAALAQQDRV